MRSVTPVIFFLGGKLEEAPVGGAGIGTKDGLS